MAQRCRRFVMHSILHADDPPRRLALGAAIATFVAFTPTVGFQTLIVLFLAWLLRANKAIGLPIVWISNPATVIPIFLGCYRVGQSLLQTEPISMDWWLELQYPPADWPGRVEFYWSRCLEIAAPLWVGSLVLGGLLGYVTYYLVYFVIRSYRLRRWGQLTPPHRPLAEPKSSGDGNGPEKDL